MLTRLKLSAQNEKLMAYLKNSAWMIAEYTLKIIASIFVTIYVARYLGPTQFGMLSYTLAVVAIIKAISKLGMDGILVRELAQYPEQVKSYMSTAFSLMVIASVLGLILLSTLIYFFEGDEQIKLYIWIIATSILFQAFFVIDFNFQAQLKSKYGFMAKSIAFGLSSIVKIYLVLIKAELIFFVVSYVFDAVIVACMLVGTHIYTKQFSFTYRLSGELIKPLMKSAWPLVVSAASAVLYMRIDQVMIKNILDTNQLGLYASSAKIFEGWIMFSYIVSVSLLPAIIKLKTHSIEVYERSLISLYRILVWLGILCAAITIFCSTSIITYSFGAKFLEAEYSLIILMIAAPFVALRTLSVRYMIAEGYERKIASRTIITLVINVILNLIFIPLFGIEGAAFSTLISFFIGSYLINYFDLDLSQLRRICKSSFFIKTRIEDSRI
jgi:O-antigen/teichoic acid export membrane protein